MFYPTVPVDPWFGYQRGSNPYLMDQPITVPRQQPLSAYPQPGALPALGSLGEGYGATPNGPYRTVRGREGWIYRQYSNGSILVVAQGSRPVGALLRPNSGQSWTAITSEIGPYSRGGDPIGQILAAFQGGGRSAGLATATEQAVKHGPGVVAAAQEYLSGRGEDVPALQRRLARLRRTAAAASGPRRQRLAAQIQIIERRIGQLQAAPTVPAVSDDPIQPGDQHAGKIPPWVTYAGLAVAVVGLLSSQGSK